VVFEERESGTKIEDICECMRSMSGPYEMNNKRYSADMNNMITMKKIMNLPWWRERRG
jgi:hypothetical protein